MSGIYTEYHSHTKKENIKEKERTGKDMKDNWTIEARAVGELGDIRVSRFEAEWDELPEKVALLMNKWSPYYYVNVEGPYNNFHIYREREAEVEGTLYLMSCAIPEGHIRQKSNYRWEICYRGAFSEYEGDFDSLEEAIRDFHRDWRGVRRR